MRKLRRKFWLNKLKENQVNRADIKACVSGLIEISRIQRLDKADNSLISGMLFSINFIKEKYNIEE